MLIQVSSYHFKSAHKKRLVDSQKAEVQQLVLKVIKNQKLEGFSYNL